MTSYQQLPETNTATYVTTRPTEQITITGILYAADPIYSPVAYARKCFGDMLEQIEYHIEGKELHFRFSKKILYRSILKWIGYIIDEDNNITWKLLNEKGEQVDMPTADNTQLTL